MAIRDRSSSLRVQLLGRAIALLGIVFLGFTQGVGAQTSPGGATPQCRSLPDAVWVEMVSWFDEWPVGSPRVQYVPLADYVQGVVMGELATAVPQGPYAGQPWDSEVLRAQSVASRTFGTYWCERRLLTNGEMGLYNSDYDQVYRPYHPAFDTTTKQRYGSISSSTQATHLTWDGLLLQAPYDGPAVDAQFRSDVGNPSMTASEAATWGIYDYLKSVNNPHTIGEDHGVGWAQTPSQGWRRASDGTAGYPQPLQQYYTGLYLQNEDGRTFQEKFWNNISCAGTPVLARQTRRVNYDWGDGSPAPGVNADSFCAEWTTTLTFERYNWGWTTFYLVVDDGMRVYLDDTLILDEWRISGPRLVSVTALLGTPPMLGGTPPPILTTHSLRVQYFENTGRAVARLSWLPGTGMSAEYFSGIIDKVAMPSLPVTMVRPDIPIRFDWHVYSPLDTRDPDPAVPRIPEDRFSERWQGFLYMRECNYVNFTARVDDGFVLSVGGATLIDSWQIQGVRNLNSNYVWLCPGTYTLEARHFENTGSAVAVVDWEWDVPPPTPMS